ncbi:succinate dehydrogenase assembly factor 2 [Sphingomicrobium aestuariivivum]|uniref:succinate dehydrogenase assembly factor 2 n=1 Tax=Sphingomicrobium aestuariivivum TaxID=1582356 RepID=UPI001FD69FE9|nr:succinate dehydrogenase assembly factor 2 [Sphingomicrobium aestuariivivum]MCJ8189939.1 succinate dehydrogenase assembly factor 2 [Sphingomicrobium aestuariivivum]
MDERLKSKLGALKYRSHHRGTREADMMIGGFFDAHHESMTEADMDWFEALLQEQDVDIMAWAIGTLPVPERYQGPMLEKLQKLDFIRIAR